MAQIRIISGKSFRKAVNYAKRAGGTYQAASKIWDIPNNCPMLGNARAYGWEIVGLAPEVNKFRADPAMLMDASLSHMSSAKCPYCQTYCDGDCQA